VEMKKRLWNSLEITKIVLGFVVAFAVLYIQLSSNKEEDHEHLLHQDSLDRVARNREDSLDRERRIEQRVTDSTGASRSEQLLMFQIVHNDSIMRVNQAFEISKMENELAQEHNFQLRASDKAEMVKVGSEALERLHTIGCFLRFELTNCEKLDTNEYRKQRSLLKILWNSNEHWFLALGVFQDFSAFDMYCTCYDISHSLLSDPASINPNVSINGIPASPGAIHDSVLFYYRDIDFKLQAQLDWIQAGLY
jgi:hypothetical protein